MAQRRYGLQVNVVEGSMLVVSCLFASFLIFVFGIYVGKEVQAQKTVEQAKPFRVPVGGSKTALLDRSPTSPPASSPSPQPAVPAQERAVPKQTVQQPKPTSPPSPAVLAKAKLPIPQPEARTDKTPRVRPVAAPPPKPPAKSRLWSVQVQATTQEATARQTVRRLRRQGYSPSISKVVRHNRVWYRVRVGPFAKEVEATATVSRFRRQKTFAQAYPVSH